jgi:hypothetical protein
MPPCKLECASHFGGASKNRAGEHLLDAVEDRLPRVNMTWVRLGICSVILLRDSVKCGAAGRFRKPSARGLQR